MQGILTLYLSGSIAASALILFLLAAKRLWKQRLSKSWQYYIWLLVVFRLLIPFSPFPGMIGDAMGPGIRAWEQRADRTVGGPEARQAAGAEVRQAADQKGQSPLAAGSGQVGKQGREQRFQPLSGLLSGPLSGLWLLWLVPAVLILLYRIYSYQSCLRVLEAASAPVEDPQILAAYQKARDELQIRRDVPVYTCKAAGAPMLAGLCKPRVLLPDDGAPPEELYYVFCHELVHYKRKDILYKWLLQLAVCIHWPNPFVYLMRRECEKACELSCDEAVVLRYTAQEKAAYGDTLVAALQRYVSPKKTPVSVLLYENTHILKERLGSIMKIKKTTKLQKAAACAVTLLLAGSLLLLGTGDMEAEASQPVKIQDSDYYGTDPWLNDPDNPESKNWRHSFMTTGFFENGYGIRMAWNNDPSLYDTTRTITAGDVYTVSFIKETERYAEDPEVLEAIRLSLLDWRQKEKADDGSQTDSGQGKTNFKMINPVIVGVDGPYEGTHDQLAVRFYEEDKIPYFVSVFKKASLETQKSMWDRAYRDRKLVYFACCADLMPADEQEKYLQKSYQDGEIAYFKIVVDDAKSEVVKPWVEKAYQDSKVSFFAAAFEEIPDADQKQYAYRSYEDGRLDFFSISVDALDSYECEKLAERARQEGKEAFRSLIPGAGGDYDDDYDLDDDIYDDDYYDDIYDDLDDIYDKDDDD